MYKSIQICVVFFSFFRCIVALYKIYNDRRPEGSKTPNSPFYLTAKPVADFSDPSEPWFENTRLGVNSIQNLMKEMKTRALKQSSEKKLTNHSVRKTSVQRLKDQNLDDSTTIAITGHKRVESVNTYRTLSDKNHKKVCRMLQDYGDVGSFSQTTVSTCTLNRGQSMWDDTHVACQEFYQDRSLAVAAAGPGASARANPSVSSTVGLGHMQSFPVPTTSRTPFAELTTPVVDSTTGLVAPSNFHMQTFPVPTTSRTPFAELTTPVVVSTTGLVAPSNFQAPAPSPVVVSTSGLVSPSTSFQTPPVAASTVVPTSGLVCPPSIFPTAPAATSSHVRIPPAVVSTAGLISSASPVISTPGLVNSFGANPGVVQTPGIANHPFHYSGLGAFFPNAILHNCKITYEYHHHHPQ